MGCCGRLYTEIASPGLRKKKSRGSLNDAISAAYVTQSLEPGWSDMILCKKVLKSQRISSGRRSESCRTE